MSKARWALLLGVAAIAGCDLNLGVEPPPPTDPTSEQPAPPDGATELPTAEVPGDDVGPVDPLEQLVHDDLAGFLVGAEGLRAVDLRALSVGAQITFSIPDNATAAKTRGSAKDHCGCAWSVQSVDGDDADPMGAFGPPDACTTVYTVLRLGDAIITATQTCGDGDPVRFVQGISTVIAPAEVDDEEEGQKDDGSGGGGPPPPVQKVVLTVALVGNGEVTVTPEGAAVAVGDGSGREYPAGTQVALTAGNSASACFFRWGGDVDSTQGAINLTLSTDTFVLAEFVDPAGPASAPVLDPVPDRTTDAVVTITGRVQSCQNDPIALVEVSGPTGEFQVVVTDGAFSADAAMSLNRTNPLFFTAISDAGVRGAPASVVITHDTQSPSLFIDFPPDGAELTNASIDVAGRVSDTLSGFMGLNVTVNGVGAIVDVGIGTNGTFERQAVPLAVGPNTLTARATDELGNSVERSIVVTRVEIPSGTPRMVVVWGNGQSAQIHSTLTDPLAVRVTKGDGSPFANKLVTFHVTRSDGRLSPVGPGPAAGVPNAMTLQVRTDADGMARVLWQVGADAGCGNNRVEATSTSIAGTTFFCASSTPAPPVQINIGTGNNQRAETGGPAPEPLRVWVNDRCNGVDNVPVTFTVTRGGGRVNDRTSITVNTGDTGHAQVEFTLGPDAGNHVIEANFASNPTNPARFVIFGVRRITDSFEGTPTSFSGLVLNNNEQPIQGATCTLTVGGATLPAVLSDINGLFQFDDVPNAGPADLHVDGLTATHVGGLGGIAVPLGSFPALHFEPHIIPKAANSLSTPVLLPPLDPANARTFDNTADLELTVEGIAGLRMIVKAGSMTRADGSVPSPADPAVITLNQVSFDKVPMPMPDGASPPFAWTLQPAGATFDPPVEVIYPNMSSLPAGSIAYFLSFNHDTMRFEIVATGSVTDDGANIVSDPGGGITTAGWGCNCPPYSVTAECANCTIELMDPMPRVAQTEETVLFNANGEPDPGDMTWSAPLGNPDSGQGNVFTTRYSLPGVYIVQATWDPDDGDPCNFEIEVNVVEILFDEHPNHDYGWDDWTDFVPDKSVENGEADEVIADLGSNTNDVFFHSNNTVVVTVLPDQSNTAAQTLLLDGQSVGVTTVEARAGAPDGEVLASVRVSVYDKVSKTLAIRLVHESNDDVQLAPVGTNVGAFAPCVDIGGNGFRDTIPNNAASNPTFAGDDELDAGNPDVANINAGANGICETEAQSEDLISTDVGTAEALQTYLNTVVYNQAVVEFAVTRLPDVTINFDFNRDGQFNADGGFLTNPEEQAVRDAARDDSFDYNVFLVDNSTDGSYGFAAFNQRYTFVHGDTHTGQASTIQNTIAHEVGHALGMCHPDAASCISEPDTDNLMFSFNPANPTRLRKAQWDQLNP